MTETHKQDSKDHSPESSEVDSQADHSELKDILFNKKLLGSFAVGCLNALGIVYGDIGTSPLYVYASIFAEQSEPPTEIQVKGALCLIVYSLTWVVCIKYLIFVLMADYRGEGGVFALVSLILHTKGNANPFHTLDHPEDFDKEEPKETVIQMQMKELQPVQRHDSISPVSPVPSVIVDDPISLRGSRRASFHSEIDHQEESHLTHSTSFMSLKKLQKSKFLYNTKVRHLYAFVALIGAGLLLGDGVITPSISVLSALEGLKLMGNSVAPAIVPLTVIVLISLFLLQRFGIAKVGLLFGPIMLLWFSTIGIIGIYHISLYPRVLEALNPYYGYKFFADFGYVGWTLMGAIVLCVTGCEAMYADMGHFGKNAVRCSWLIVVYPALLCNYIGQAAMLIRRPETISNPFYESIPVPGLYIPIIILATMATIIASQALISGAFSITQQAITLGTFPRMKVIHTSDKVEGQIYIPTLNYMLMIVCIILVVSFGSSTALSNAYGLAVCGDMTLTTLIFSSIARFRWRWHPVPWAILTAILIVVDGVFLSSTLLKIPNGGYVPLIIAFFVSSVMFIWRKGKARLNLALKNDQLPFNVLQQRMHRGEIKRCPGVAVFMSSLAEGVPVSANILASHIPYLPETVIFLTIKHQHVPYVKQFNHVFVDALPEKGFYRIIAQYGYRETQISMDQLFNECAAIMPEVFHDIELSKTSFFLSTEHVRLDKSNWFFHKLYIRLFKSILQLSYSVPHTFKIPNQSLVIMGSEVYL